MKLVFKLTGIAAVTEVYFLKMYHTKVLFTTAIPCKVRTRSCGNKFLLA